MMTCVLLVDDEPAITESLAYAFQRAGIDSRSAACLADAQKLVDQEFFDLIVLDLMLPDGNGIDWLRALRTESQIPVIILSSHDDTVDQVVGLELGADDYIGKPFSPREVVARVRAVLRRFGPPAQRVPSGLHIDEQKRQVFSGDTQLLLSRTEFDLLNLFASQPGRVYERDHILTKVWGPDVSVTERTVDVHVKSLRKKLVAAGLGPDAIETVRGVGYRLAED
jgi:DNA-binding response OmpR family regulator